jgi:GNAT superfamily N-acetyltransferase
MADTEIVRGDRVTLIPVPAGVDLDALGTLTGGRTAGRGWPHADTGAGLAFTAAGGSTWLIADADDAVVGECGTKLPPQAGVVEIGYGLAGPSRGRGLGTRAVGALVDWLAAQPDIDRVLAFVAMDNLASRRLLERLGFVVDHLAGSEVVYARSLTGGPPPRAGKVDLSNGESQPRGHEAHDPEAPAS